MAEVAGAKKFVFVVFLSFFHVGKAIREWHREEFPKPSKDIEDCGRGGVVSWICDPDRILSPENANKVEELLYSVRKNTASGCGRDENPGFEIGVAILNQMHRSSQESLPEAAENFAKHLHYWWGVGHAGCDDGVLLLVSTLDRQVFVSAGKRAMVFLRKDQIDIIIEQMEPHLQAKDYGQSVELAVVRMGEVFSGKVLKRPTTPTFGKIVTLAVCFGVMWYAAKTVTVKEIIIPKLVKLLEPLEPLLKRLEPLLKWLKKLKKMRKLKRSLEGPSSEPTFVRSSMPGSGSMGSRSSFGGGSSQKVGGSGGSW